MSTRSPVQRSNPLGHRAPTVALLYPTFIMFTYGLWHKIKLYYKLKDNNQFTGNLVDGYASYFKKNIFTSVKKNCVTESID